jgi:hypothetical protein
MDVDEKTPGKPAARVACWYLAGFVTILKA